MPYLEGYVACSYWYLPRFANPWSLFLPNKRAAWDEGWVDAISDRLPLPARRCEPECVPHD